MNPLKLLWSLLNAPMPTKVVRFLTSLPATLVMVLILFMVCIMPWLDLFRALANPDDAWLGPNLQISLGTLIAMTVFKMFSGAALWAIPFISAYFGYKAANKRSLGAGFAVAILSSTPFVLLAMVLALATALINSH